MLLADVWQFHCTCEPRLLYLPREGGVRCAVCGQMGEWRQLEVEPTFDMTSGVQRPLRAELQGLRHAEPDLSNP